MVALQHEQAPSKAKRRGLLRPVNTELIAALGLNVVLWALIAVGLKMLP